MGFTSSGGMHTRHGPRAKLFLEPFDLNSKPQPPDSNLKSQNSSPKTQNPIDNL